MIKLVMNYFVTEGYVDAAENFRLETGTEQIDLATITDRMLVKKAVIKGNVQEDIERVNNPNPEIRDTNPQLFFHLQQQRLIEVIRQKDFDKALEFAREGKKMYTRPVEVIFLSCFQSHYYYFAEQPHFLEELERTVALLAFVDTHNCPLKELMDQHIAIGQQVR